MPKEHLESGTAIFLEIILIGGNIMNSRSIRIALDLMTLLDNQCKDTEYECECCELNSNEEYEGQTICDKIMQVTRKILQDTVDE